jgi:phosphopantetheinyl transferase (holo-ACP synthase)
MSGMEMMLKSLGVDVSELQKIPSMVKQVHETFTRIEAKLDRILAIAESEYIENGTNTSNTIGTGNGGSGGSDSAS